MIGSDAFGGCNCISNLEFHCKEIGVWFRNLKSIQNIVIGDEVTSIGDNVFNECCGLTTVTIGKSVTKIGGTAFSGCSSLTSVVIPKSVKDIGAFAFYNCSGLTSITIPNSVTSIGRSAFSGCSGLRSIVVDPDNKTYDSRDGCNAIIKTSENTLIFGCKNTVIPNSVTSIGEYTFQGCSGLTSITIPNSVTSIGDYTFQGCSGLTSITIPNTVTSIGYEAFYGCSGLASIVVESGNTVYDSRSNCNAIIETESNRLMVGCKETVIPSSVTSIGDYAFSGRSGLTSVTIPKSVTSIGGSAFEDCRLETVVTKSTNCSIATSSFSKPTLQHAMLYIPAGTWRDLVYESGWYLFNNIREMSAETHELATSRAYTLMDAQTFNYVVYDGVNQTLCTKDGYYQVDESNPNTSWQVVDQGNKKYLYNIGARKYAAMKGDGDLSLSDTPVALDMRNGDKGIVLGNHPQKQWYFVLNQNVEAENIQTAIDGITTTDAQTSEVYSLSGVRTNRPQHGVSIVKMSDGTIKKVLVK